MELPMWTKYDADFYRSLSLFPERLENKPLSPREFTTYFKPFDGRPVQDIIEALHWYGNKGYFKFELTLNPSYLEQGNFLSEAMAKLSGSDVAPNKYHGLGNRVYAKVLADRPLTKAEASKLPENAKPYLAFSLSIIDRQRLKEGLAIYDSHLHRPIIHPGKIATKLPPLDLKDVRLEPGSYDKRTGILHLARFYRVSIAGKLGVKRPSGQKYEQCWVMECIFKSDETISKGVRISALVGKHEDAVDKTTTRKIENAVAEINKKVTDVTHSKNLLMIDDKKVKITPYYL
jgi:hypothetical protein